MFLLNKKNIFTVCFRGNIIIIIKYIDIELIILFIGRRQMEDSGKSAAKLEEVKVEVIEATAESFKEYGQVIGPSRDGEEFGPQDAQLHLTQGIPRSSSQISLLPFYYYHYSTTHTHTHTLLRVFISSKK